MDTTILKDVGVLIAIFMIVGLGVGTAGAVALSQSESQFGGAFLMIAFLPAIYVSGPLIGTFGGIILGLVRGSRESIASSGVGSFLGFYLFVAIALVLLVVGLSLVPSSGMGGASGTGGTGSGGGADIPWLVVASLGLPTGLVGAIGGVIGKQFRS